MKAGKAVQYCTGNMVKLSVRYCTSCILGHIILRTVVKQ